MRITRKDLLAAIELVGNERGTVIVHRPSHKKYEVRATRKLRGIDLKWTVPGKFFDPSR